MIIKIEQKIVKDNGADGSTSYNYYYFECDNFSVVRDYDENENHFSPNQLLYDKFYDRAVMPSLLKLYKSEDRIGMILFSTCYIIDSNTGKTVDKIS